MVGMAAREEGPASLDVAIARLSPAAMREVGDVYIKHHKDVYRYVLALTRSSDIADEVVAETFERAVRSWSPGPASPLPWLLLTARRIATDRWRRARRFARLGIHLRGSRTSDDPQQQTEFWMWFDALASVLSARQREALVLRYQRDLDDRDIGLIMGLSESGVRSLVARALAELRSHPELTR